MPVKDIWRVLFMERKDIYKDIAERTDGNIFIGVVGTVRTGKSTFSAKVLEKLILPNVESGLAKKIAVDETPQSADGKTVMTTQLKFIPQEAVKVNLGDNVVANMRLIDCVGYMVDGANGDKEDGKDRLVQTPWQEEKTTFAEAARIGTEKVITEYSTVCVMVTTDGSFTGIDRAAYKEKEIEIVKELKKRDKPFCVLLNVADVKAKGVNELKEEMYKEYGAPVIVKNAVEIDEKDVAEILGETLLDFNVKRIDIDVPEWVRTLSEENPLIAEIKERALAVSERVVKMKDFGEFVGAKEGDKTKGYEIKEVNLSNGVIKCGQGVKDGVFYDVVSTECGAEIKNDYHLLSYIKTLATAKREYDKIKDAVESAKANGYGVVIPPSVDITVDEPKIVETKGGCRVKINAKTESMHVLNVGVSAEVTPFVGDKKRCEEMVEYLKNNNDGDILNSELFGKPLSDIVYDGIRNKLNNLQKDASEKLVKTVGRIVNEGNGGVICILL